MDTSHLGVHMFSDVQTSDQTIEQTLMKGMSVEGGPFKLGATESVVYKWIRGVIYSQDIIEGIENFCNISFNKSHQHSNSTDARIDRNDIDDKLLVDFFIQHSPFPDTDAIIPIATGITGYKDINCYDAFEQGLTAMKQTEGQNLRELKLSRKEKINPLLVKNSKIKILDDVITVEPFLLFQRICVLKKTDEELQNYMNYELARYPLCLFEDGELWKTKKSTFYELFPKISFNLRTSLDVSDDDLFENVVELPPIPCSESQSELPQGIRVYK
ncbi:uncharacterized protein TNCV_718521 [Trichonephila clavipes]|nr:uncharacterized protein TNCV_718521 [Trichonephila clavipes]